MIAGLQYNAAGMRRIEVMAAIIEERQYQDNKWGSIEAHPHTVGEWILLIEDELNEAKRALIKGGTGRDSVISELVQVAALALACLEQHGLEERGRSV